MRELCGGITMLLIWEYDDEMQSQEACTGHRKHSFKSQSELITF